MNIRFTAVLFSIALVPFAAGCRTGTDAKVQNAVAETSMASSTPGMNTITDADAGAVAHTINDGEIQLAQLALANASSQQVRDFAQMMLSDHQTGNQLLESNGYGIARNPITDVLNAEVNKRMAALRGTTGAAFDRAFLAHQIDLHSTALETMRTTLMPSAQAPALRQSLSTLRNSVQMHLDRARALQQGLGR